MKYNLLLKYIILFLIFLLLWNCGAENSEPPIPKDAVRIGETLFFTEKKPMADVLTLAAKENKSVISFYHDSGDLLSYVIKMVVLENPGLSTIGSESLFRFINVSTKAGKEQCQKEKVWSFPAAIVHSSQGAHLDSGFTGNNFDNFLYWFNRVKNGDNYAELLKKAESVSDERERLYNLCLKLGNTNFEQKIDYLNRALAINNDLKDQLTLKILEEQCYLVIKNLPTDEKELESYLASGRDHVDKVFDIFSGEFNNKLKSHHGISLLIDWYSLTDRPHRAVEIFKKAIAMYRNIYQFFIDLVLVSSVLDALFDVDPVEAVLWVENSLRYTKLNHIQIFSPVYAYYLSPILCTAVTRLHGSGHTAEAEKYASIHDDVMNRLGYKRAAGIEIYQGSNRRAGLIQGN